MAPTRKFDKATSTTGLRPSSRRNLKIEKPMDLPSLRNRLKREKICKIHPPVKKDDNKEKACLPNRLVKERFLPERPKMFARDFALFVHDFAMNNAVWGKKLFIRAASEWKKIPDSTKMEYQKRSAQDKERFKNEFAQWALIRQMLKAPPNSYALFVKAVYKNCTNLQECDGGFRGLSKQIAKLWASLPEDKKQEFIEKSDQFRHEYIDIVEQLVNGRDVYAILQEQLGSESDDEDVAQKSDKV